MYKQGDSVKINEEGHSLYGSSFMNPRGKIGKVVDRPTFLPLDREVDPEWTWVLWEDGIENSYQEGTLDIVEG